MTKDTWAGRFLSGASFWTPEYPGGSAWMEHAPFAFWLMEAARPRVFVELGTHTGFSHLAFCQAVSRLQIAAKGFAVDTWEGDEQTGFYGAEVLEELAPYHDRRYGAFSRLVKATFDEAVESFENGSIDLLHVDGLHSYEAVRHDFETWRPKLSERAIVLLHDTNVREPGFGVHRLWAELSTEHPSFEFVHAHGLAVFGVGEELPITLAALFEAEADREVAAAVRTAYAHLGSTVRLRWELAVAQDAIRTGAEERSEVAEHLAARAGEVSALEKGLAERIREIASLERRLRAQASELRSLRENVNWLEGERAQVEARLGEATSQAQETQSWAADLEYRLLITLGSRSWRLTKPLRRAGSAARRLVGPRRAATAAAPAPDSAPVQTDRRRERTHVVFVSGEPHTPGHLYRIGHVAASLPQRFFETTTLTLADLPSAELADVDILWIWRAPYSSELASAINAVRERSTAIVYDVDDLMFRPDLARADIIDGIRTHEYRESDVKGLFEAVQRALVEADHCTAPTATLARQLRMLGKPTTVVPNTFDGSFLRSARRVLHERADRQVVRIGYAAGSFTHQRDLAVAVPALARVLHEHSETRFVTFEGGVDLTEFSELDALHDQIEMRSLVPLDELSDEYGRFDVNIAPLESGNPFCEAKSELKLFEAALAGAVTVASPTEPFLAAIKQGETGFLAATEDEWYEALSLLVNDRALRSRVALAAYRDVLWQFGPERLSSITTRLAHRLVDKAPSVAGLDRLAVTEQTTTRPSIEIPEYEVLFESSDAPPSRVAVVMPVYNYATWIEGALDSVRRQSLRVLDLVVVDDCSTDDSVELTRRWLERNGSRFNRAALLRNQRNSKLARTRNAGVAYADTELYFPLDPDNELLPNCLDKALAQLDETGAAFAYPTIELFGEAKGTTQYLDWDPSLLRGANYIDAMALVRRACWIAVGGYSPLDPTGWEDYDFWCKFVENGFYGTRITAITARYRVHSRSMLSTTTDRPENKAKIVAEITRRHPWLDIALTEGRNDLAAIREVDAPFAAKVSSAGTGEALGWERLRRLLICPATGEELVRDESGTSLVSSDSRRVWPIVDGRPVFIPAASAVARHPDEHMSNPLPHEALDMFQNTEGFVLNLSAGGTDERRANVVEVEYAIFRNTDVVADAHDLPFRDESFEAVVSLNAFEHYRDPVRAAKEIWRVLKPGGRLLLRTAFLQPIHEEPFHFFNCTRYGLEQWLANFEIDEIRVSENFNPIHSLSWLASDLDLGFAQLSRERSRAFQQVRVEELIEFWRREDSRDGRLAEMFEALPDDTQQKTAAGWQALARKPNPS
jgi:glycosyltransferase involved in cell wall biosynthesis/SAM-dependent methyltransferase/uncharacterized protein YbaR (Trm112 family)